MVETTENQICSPFYDVFKPYLLCIAVILLVPSVVLTSFLGLGFFFYPILFTILILIFSTSNFLVKLTKKRKVVLVGNYNPDSKEKLLFDDHDDEVEVQEKVVMETSTESDAAQVANIGIVLHDDEIQVPDESLDLTSDSEISDDDDEDDEDDGSQNWVISCKNEEQNNPEISDDSTSECDEEGLIEIAIPSNNIECNIGLSEEPKQNLLQSNLPTFLPESIFKLQQEDHLFDQLVQAEMNEANEEENLIEIDISMGSIKCPRFEIEA